MKSDIMSQRLLLHAWLCAAAVLPFVLQGCGGKDDGKASCGKRDLLCLCKADCVSTCSSDRKVTNFMNKNTYVNQEAFPPSVCVGLLFLRRGPPPSTSSPPPPLAPPPPHLRP